MNPASEPVRTSSGNRRDDIQGLRALAVLMVVAYHAGLPWPGGFTGPDVFFVVSGFVVTGMLLREHAATGRIALVPFYLRRARRLAPALAVVSLVTLVAAVFVLSPLGADQEVAARAVAAASTLRANIYFLRETGGYFQPAAQTNPFLHTWTLSVEEQFYLAFPVTLLGLWWAQRRWGRPRLGIVLLSLGCVASLVACVALSYGDMPRGWRYLSHVLRSDDPQRDAFFSAFLRAWEFGGGVLLACAARRWTPGAIVRHGAAIAGALMLLLTIVAIHDTAVFPGVVVLLPVVGTLALLIGGLGSSTTFVNRVLSFKPFVWLGDRSYSWYLWHWPLIVFARVMYVGAPHVAAAAAAVSLVPAALSFQFVEEPIRRRRVWPTSRATAAIAAVSILAPLSCAIAFRTAVDHAWGVPEIAQIRADSIPDHIDVIARCAATQPLGDPARTPCMWTSSPSRGTVLLIGDSHAGHFSEAFIAAANALHYDAEVATAGGCPFVQRPVYHTDACRAFVEGSLAAIARRVPAYAAVVISSATTGYLDGPMAPSFVADASPGAAIARPAEVAGWLASLTRSIDTIDRRSPVVVVGAVPQFYQVPQCLRPTLFTERARGCGEWTAAFAARFRTDVITAERAKVQALGGTYLDAGARFCSPGKGCSAFLDGRVAYRNGGHLSVEAGRSFEPDFRAALASATSHDDIVERVEE